MILHASPRARHGCATCKLARYHINRISTRLTPNMWTCQSQASPIATIKSRFATQAGAKSRNADMLACGLSCVSKCGWATYVPKASTLSCDFFSCWRDSHSQLGVAQSFALRITLVWAGTKGLLEGVAGPGPTPVHTAGAYPLPQLLATG